MTSSGVLPEGLKERVDAVSPATKATVLAGVAGGVVGTLLSPPLGGVLGGRGDGAVSMSCCSNNLALWNNDPRVSPATDTQLATLSEPV